MTFWVVHYVYTKSYDLAIDGINQHNPIKGETEKKLQYQVQNLTFFRTFKKFQKSLNTQSKT